MIKQRICIILLAASISIQALASGPGLINYSGRLTDSAQVPVTVQTPVVFTFWDSAAGGNQLGEGYDYHTNVTPNTDGVYSVAIGDGEPVPSAIFDTSSVWLNVNVNGEDLAPRAQITSVGYAFHAEEADMATTANTAAQALGLTGGSFLMTQATGTAVENGANLLATYDQVKSLTPGGEDLATTNRVVLLVVPGQYDLGTGHLLLDTEFVDIVGLSSEKADQYIFGESNGAGTGVLEQTANDVRINNLTIKCTLTAGDDILPPDDTSQAAYFPISDTPATIIKNCEFKSNNVNALAMRAAIEYSGTYLDCVSGKNSFGRIGEASGTFVNCVADDHSFASGGIASGTFKNCSGGNWVFGNNGGSATGSFYNCSGGQFAFGGYGLAEGNFVNCTGGDSSFGGGTASSKASGVFTSCTGLEDSFGGGSATSNGKFRYCTGETGSFGGVTGVYLFCILNDTEL